MNSGGRTPLEDEVFRLILVAIVGVVVEVEGEVEDVDVVKDEDKVEGSVAAVAVVVVVFMVAVVKAGEDGADAAAASSISMVGSVVRCFCLIIDCKSVPSRDKGWRSPKDGALWTGPDLGTGDGDGRGRITNRIDYVRSCANEGSEVEEQT